MGNKRSCLRNKRRYCFSKLCIYASLFHNSMLDEKKRHQFCPPTKDSWCTWQKEIVEKGVTEFILKLSIPQAIFDVILPICKKLTNDNLLEKCLHGKTQNSNEAFHSLVWQRCPKTIYCGEKSIRNRNCKCCLPYE